MLPLHNDFCHCVLALQGYLLGPWLMQFVETIKFAENWHLAVCQIGVCYMWLWHSDLEIGN